MKNINTLVKDIESLFENPGSSLELTEQDNEFQKLISSRLDTPRKEKKKGEEFLRASNIGTPCKRQLWYKINDPEGGEKLRPATLTKFLYGDLVELLLLTLVRKSGHSSVDEQKEVEINGVKGHLDTVIDGMVVDIKSASPFSFDRFQKGLQKEDDKFGYLDQLEFYLAGSQDNPNVTEKNKAAFLAINKVSGEICLDVHEFSNPVKNMEEKVESSVSLVLQKEEPERSFTEVPDGKSGNLKLGTECSYCGWKEKCWPNLKTYLYAGGPRFLTRVVKEPNVPSF